MTAPAAEPRTLAPLGRRLVRVVAHDAVGAFRMLVLDDPDGPPDPRPGQFYMLAAEARWGGGEETGRPYLPRALSFARVEPGPRLSFLLQGIGPGTVRLVELEPGDGVWVLGPLGVGFRSPSGAPLLVGGGIGVAPLLCLADALGPPPPPVLLGFRSAGHAAAAALFPGAWVATDDGSRGHAGYVTELLADELDRERATEVLACGPPAMLEAVRALCAERGVPAQLALESGMACGFGACYGCVHPTRSGYVRLCLDGPVLDAAALERVVEPGGER